jgi:hypothetical protein
VGGVHRVLGVHVSVLPRGRLESGLPRGLVLVLPLSSVVLWGLILVFSPSLSLGLDFTNCGTNCPPNAFQLASGHAAIGKALNTGYSVVTTISVIGIAMLIFHKARSGTQLRRRAMTPLALVSSRTSPSS